MTHTEITKFVDDLQNQFSGLIDVRIGQAVFTESIEIKLPDPKHHCITIFFEEGQFDTMLLHTANSGPIELKNSQDIDMLIAVLEYIKTKLDI